MMDFVDSLRRGVDRAGFEVDRLLRANRVRSRINTLRAQSDEEVRQIGHHVLELCRRGELVQAELREHCDRVEQYEREIAQRQAELDDINRETPFSFPQEPAPHQPIEILRPGSIKCPNCGTMLPEDAVFCHRCGANVKAALQVPPPPPEQPA